MHVLFRGGTLIAALVGSSIGMVLILPLGLVVDEFVIFPLAMSIAALLAALSASWAGSLLATDQSRTRLVPVVGCTEATGAVIALVVIANADVRMLLLGPVAGIGGVCSLLLALSATVATWRFRSATHAAGREIDLTVVLLVCAAVGVPAVIFLAALAGLVGA